LLVIALAASAAAQERIANAAAGAESSRPAVVIQGLDADGQLRLSVGHSHTLTTARPLRNADRAGAALTVGSAEVVAVQPISSTAILVTAKKPGSTNLVIEDESGRRQSVEVIVEPDLTALRRQLAELNSQAKINVDQDNGVLLLRGHAPELQVAQQAAQIAAAYCGGPSKVVNLLEISGGQQVMLQVKFAEVSKTAMSQLGVNFGYTDGNSFFGSNVGQVSALGIASGNLLAAGTDLLNVPTPGANVQLFGDAQFGKSALAYFVNCLHENQLMRTLAEPNLTAISGQTASFQVGGQIPVPVPQENSAGAGTPTITIQYENYGVILHFTPVVLGDGRIRLKIEPEVSDLDYAHGVSIDGFVVPGFTTRTVDTTVELADGQTFTIAGLLSNQVTATSQMVPGLGELPILGTLFRSVQYERDQTELVVMVTPRLVEAVNPNQVTEAPGEYWRYPSEAALLLGGDLGGEKTPPSPAAKSAGPPPPFFGQNGFVPTADTHVVEP
jgi:pilus assembly protein CpaC